MHALLGSAVAVARVEDRFFLYVFFFPNANEKLLTSIQFLRSVPFCSSGKVTNKLNFTYTHTHTDKLPGRRFFKISFTSLSRRKNKRNMSRTRTLGQLLGFSSKPSTHPPSTCKQTHETFELQQSFSEEEAEIQTNSVRRDKKG